MCVLVLDYQSPFRGVHNSSKFWGEDEVDVQRSGQYLHADRRQKQELESNNHKGGLNELQNPDPWCESFCQAHSKRIPFKRVVLLIVL